MNAIRLPVWLSAVLLLLVVVRVGGVVASAISNTHGDYYASLPGAYVRTVNPTLWESPDLQGAMGYHLDTYYHGPTQYLTLYPVAMLNSYAQIAWMLLLIYAGVIALAIGCLIGAFRRLTPDTPLTIPVVAATLLFFPLLQSYLQREFEVVVFLGLAAALWLSIADRRGPASAVLAYVAWFKYVPLLFLGYLMLRGWFRAAVVFLVTSVAILLLAHAVFDLSLFVNNNVPAHAAQVMRVASYEFRTDPAGHMYGLGFCTGWFDSETTLANIRHGFCSAGARWPWFPPNLAYLLLCAAIAIVYVMAHLRFERDRKLSPERERWRRALEFSIITTICACFFFAHYYYLIILAIPMNVLLARYLSRGDYLRLAVWGLSYFFLSAFLVPTGVLTRAIGTDVWARFIKDGWFLYGELLLVALLLREYLALSRGRPLQVTAEESSRRQTQNPSTTSG